MNNTNQPPYKETDPSYIERIEAALDEAEVLSEQDPTRMTHNEVFASKVQIKKGLHQEASAAINKIKKNYQL